MIEEEILWRKRNEIDAFCNKLDVNKELQKSIAKLIHELKNPLAVCNGYLEMIVSSDELTKEKYLNIVGEEIRRCLAIINDFSFFIKTKKLKKEELDIVLMLEEIKDILYFLFKDNNCEIFIYGVDELYLCGDYDKLKQVFINILKNAFEAKNKSFLHVVIDVKKKQNECQILISDNGCGMTQEELKNIYDDYYTTKKTGSGLGIPYCREIIELHGGNINYKSKKNHGTTVVVTLPMY